MTDDYDLSTYGDRWAEIYDEKFAPPCHTDATVAFLAQQAGAGPALELGIGTGRVALSLAERGIAVHGIEASEAMVAKLRSKPGGEQIPVTVGDFADVGVEAAFPLIFAALDTFFWLPSQEDQVRCIANVARHLTEDGVFVIEATVPDLHGLHLEHQLSAVDVTSTSISLYASQHDRVRQRITSNLVVVGEEGLQCFPVQTRYAWPSELDLMARLAGLQLRERWGGWSREPFTSDSRWHISVYQRGS